LFIPPFIISLKNKGAKEIFSKIPEYLEKVDLKNYTPEEINKRFSNIMGSLPKMANVSLTTETESESQNNGTNNNTNTNSNSTTKKLFPPPEQIIEQFKPETLLVFIINAEYGVVDGTTESQYKNEKEVIFDDAVAISSETVKDLTAIREIKSNERFQLLREDSEETKVLKERARLEQLLQQQQEQQRIEQEKIKKQEEERAARAKQEEETRAAEIQKQKDAIKAQQQALDNELAQRQAAQQKTQQQMQTATQTTQEAQQKAQQLQTRSQNLANAYKRK
jgi:hypothetical protein